MIWIAVTAWLCYFLLIGAFYIGWKRLHTPAEKNASLKVGVSVVVAMRNESHNVGEFLQSIAAQQYESFEVIVVDDHSEDNTLQLLKDFQKGTVIDLHVTSLQQGMGKKTALAKGIVMAKYELIVTTDADCRMGGLWLQALVNTYIAEKKPAMVLAPVALENGGRAFDKWQALEFGSLMASTAGATGIGKPFMCNGANLLFRKAVYEEMGGYASHATRLSGDDVFLLHQLKQQGKKIVFAKDYNAVVWTKAQDSLNGFVQQRMRWAGKTKHYTDIFSLVVAGVVFGYSLLMLGRLCVLPWCCQVPVLLWLGKIAVDFPLLYSYFSFVKQRQLLKHYLFVQMLYPFYVCLVVFLMLFGKFEWKGRGEA